MHASLKPRTNVFAIGACATLGAVTLLVSHPSPAVPALLGVLLGGVVGVLQKSSIRGAAASFRNAETAMDVRRAFMATPSGKRAIQIQWVAAILILAAAIWLGNPIGGFVAGYSLLMCTRDLVALSAAVGLDKGGSAVEQ